MNVACFVLAVYTCEGFVFMRRLGSHLPSSTLLAFTQAGVCWQGAHLAYAAVALLTLAVHHSSSVLGLAAWQVCARTSLFAVFPFVCV